MTQSKPPLVCYHSKCPDGFAAAFAAWLVLGDDAEYLPCQYSTPAPVDVADRDVYILDFSFPLETMQRMGEVARSLTLLDHHESAEETLGRFKPLCCGKVHFDMGRSGAVLAWNHFHPNVPVPYLFECVQSRDLWRWDVPYDKEFLAWLDSLPQDFTAWHELLVATPEEVERCIDKGRAMNRKFEVLVESIAAPGWPVRIAGVDGLMVNATPEFVSEVGNLLANRSGTFGLVWRVLPDRRVKCSLRSNKPFSCLALAKQFGGGGHPQSASFVLPMDRLLDVVQGNIEPSQTVHS